MALAADHSKAVDLFVVYSLFNFASIVCGVIVLGLCLVMQYFVSFLVLQSSHWGRESWQHYFYCLLDSMWLLWFFATLPCGAVGWSAVCDCALSWSYSLFSDR